MPVTLFYGPAEAIARKSALGCHKIPTSPLLSPSWAHLSELIRPPFPQFLAKVGTGMGHRLERVAGSFVHGRQRPRDERQESP